ncbi:MAG: hypothetical protein EOM59_06510 [Clostridia bacterium]|nr:hypothetical protein [Clostridia bacterium]
MKRHRNLILVVVMLSVMIFNTAVVFATGAGNIDSGGGSTGSGSTGNKWSGGNDGIRVTVIRASDRAVITKSVDITNFDASGVTAHFGKVCKVSYNSGSTLSPKVGGYAYYNPGQKLPRIISSGTVSASIDAIKSYFTDEQVIRYICEITGMSFESLTTGDDYRLLLEPIVYLTYSGIPMAMTATEAALFDIQTGGDLNIKLGSVTKQNLPLSIFLEKPDLGYPAWKGSTTTRQSNETIIAQLGLGIVRFSELPTDEGDVGSYDYEYRTGTEVITAVTVSGGQSDPDDPASAKFIIGGNTYRVNNVYYPSGDSQLAWVRWTTPDTPQDMTIQVSVSGQGALDRSTIHVKIVDLSNNPPPNPVASDRKSGYARLTDTPQKQEKTSTKWGIWRPWWHAYWVWHSTGENSGYWRDHGWWEFDYDTYYARLSGTMEIMPDEKSSTASGDTMKSGYGINQSTAAHVITNQSSAVTEAQTAVCYFPEFQYGTYWRLLERIQSGYTAEFEFAQNQYSTYNRRTHFTPIWFPDGSYTAYTWLADCWTPDGMLSMNLTDSVEIDGNLWTDWHIKPVKQ